MQKRYTVGRCPSCSVQLSAENVLFETEFEAVEGSISYAECPSCREVVNPLRYG